MGSDNPSAADSLRQNSLSRHKLLANLLSLMFNGRALTNSKVF
jgi:hypothetical protein